MDCSYVIERLSEYADGMLPEAEASKIKEHLAECAGCLDAYESMLKIIEHMNQMQSVEEPADFLERVNARLEKRFSWDRFVRLMFLPLRIKLPLELAGITAACVLLVYIFAIRDGRPVHEITLDMTMTRPPAAIVLESTESERAAEPKSRGKKGPKQEISVQTIVESLYGTVIESEYLEGTNTPASILVEIRADKYPTLLRELKQLGVTGETPSEISKENREFIRVKIIFERSDAQQKK